MGRWLTTAGLILDAASVAVLWYYAKWTAGAVTPADQDMLASACWTRVGYGLLAVGVVLQVIGTWTSS
jgi:hypothetical protein